MADITTEFTYDGIPDLPEGQVMPQQAPPPMPQVNRGDARPVNGIPQFEVVPVRKADGSYANVEFVSILTPGDPKSVPRMKVTDRIRQMYAPWYERWRKGLEVSAHGTPLEMFPRLTPAQVRELKGLNIFTVEDLAEVADANLHRLPMGMTLKKEAGIWLKSKKETDAIEAQVRENQAQRDAMAMLEKQNADLMRRLEALETQKAEPAPVAEPIGSGGVQSSDFATALSREIDNKADAAPKRGRKKKEA